MAMAMHLSETFSIIEPSTTIYVAMYLPPASLSSVLFLSVLSSEVSSQQTERQAQAPAASAHGIS